MTVEETPKHVINYVFNLRVVLKLVMRQTRYHFQHKLTKLGKDIIIIVLTYRKVDVVAVYYVLI